MSESTSSQRNPYEDAEINLLEIARLLLKRKMIILLCAGAVTTASVGLNLMRPNLYTSTATLMPIEKTQTSNLASMLGSMGGGLGLLAAQAGIGGSGAADKFVTVLQTRSMGETLISKYNLKPVLFRDSWDVDKQKWKEPRFKISSEPKKTAGPSMQEAVRTLAESTSIKSDKKSGVISISVTTWDPEISAKVANAFVDELNLYLKTNALSVAKRNRLFVEQQLNKAQLELVEYEQAMKNFQQKNKLLSFEIQAEASVKTYSELKARVIASEVELRVLEKGTMEGDPRITLKRQEVSELKRQLANFEDGAGSGPIVTFQNAPSLGLDYVRLKRELMVRGKVVELLTQQYEMAKIQEAQEDISLQVLDPAIAPEKKSAPSRTVNVLMSFAASLVLGALLALGVEFFSANRRAFRQALDA